MFKKEITLVNKSSNLTPEKSKLHLDHIKKRILASNRCARGWKVEITSKDNSAQLQLTCVPKRRRKEESLNNEFDKIVKVIQDAGRGQKWFLDTVDEEEQKHPDAEVSYTESSIPPDYLKYFSHVFGRNNQISLVVSAVQAAMDSDWNNRFHVALIGPPATGKTEIAHSLKHMVGEECVLEYDATATTQAGAIKDLDSRMEMPRILVVEEIEKAEENSLRWLLSVLDHRAEIRKVNFRSNIHRSVKMLCVATVNNEKLFKGLMSGALASRFAHHLHCPAPDRNLLEKILSREVAKVGGRKEWIKATLDYTVENNIYDPRRVLAICLCGKDGLLSGEYQKYLDSCCLNKNTDCLKDT